MRKTLACALIASCVLLFAASAQAATLEGGSLALVIPDTWEGDFQEKEGQFVLYPKSQDVALIVGVHDTGHHPEGAFAQSLSEALNGDEPKEDRNGLYVFRCEVEDDPMTVHIAVEGGTAFVYGVLGDGAPFADDVRAILNSVKVQSTGGDDPNVAKAVERAKTP